MGRHRGALQNLDGIRTKFGENGFLSPTSSRKMISRGLTKLALSAGDQPPIFPSDILLILGRELYATRFCPAQDTKYLLIENRAAYLR